MPGGACDSMIISRTEGISQAGSQQGMKDLRSALLKECFRIYDEMITPPGPHSPLC